MVNGSNMSAEKIISKIKKDAEIEIKKIIKEAEKQASEILKESKNKAELEAKMILNEGNKQSENNQKILISKSIQDMKREIMNEREKIIQECFVKAHHKLSTLSEKEHKKIVTKLIEEGQKKLGGNCKVFVSREQEKLIAQNLGLDVLGKVEASGGVKLVSLDNSVTLDYTFDGILKREKDRIRIKVGRLLFSS